MVSDNDITKNILNIHRSRERAIYYRNGQPTRLLPADPASKAMYLNKGLTLAPEKEKREVTDGVACPLCEFVAKDAFGLSAHLRKHSKKEE